MNLEEKYQEIKKIWLEGRSLVQNKKAEVLCGIPGAGKTTYAQHRRFENYVIFDGDRFIDSCDGLNFVAGSISMRLLKETTDSGYNILFENPLNNADKILHSCILNKRKGYDISLTAIAIDSRTAFYSALNRAEMSVAVGKKPRLCSYLFMKDKIENFLRQFEILEKSNVFSSVNIIGRDGCRLNHAADEGKCHELLVKITDFEGYIQSETELKAAFNCFTEKYHLMRNDD